MAARTVLQALPVWPCGVRREWDGKVGQSAYAEYKHSSVEIPVPLESFFCRIGFFFLRFAASASIIPNLERGFI